MAEICHDKFDKDTVIFGQMSDDKMINLNIFIILFYFLLQLVRIYVGILCFLVLYVVYVTPPPPPQQKKQQQITEC